ncbi:head decoration protein [Agrobacterium tumefaciens]|uniref:Head decoration protein n=1 Tax=Agrobacterium tumefaciens TaxID=358 RepID=A0AAJ4N049_AGRTU|nr:head decoration protein [Agrobacterium tumefaciens]
MATINAPYDAHMAGVPRQWTDQINPVAEGLIVGETPAVVTEDMTVAASQTITGVYVPVGFDGSGNLVPAVSGTTQAIGILLRPITTPASPIQGQPVLRQGCVNMDMIAWPASYDTEEKKLEAFRGAPTPSSIVVRKVRAGSIVAQP